MGVASLVLGIIALVSDLVPGIGWIPGLIMAIIGVILGALGRKDPAKAGLATGGLVCSIIALVLCGVTFLACGGAAACTTCAAFSNM